MTKGSPYVAEIISSQGYTVKTYPQIWKDKACNTRNRFIKLESTEILGLLNGTFISLLNAVEYKTAINVVDGIILWE